MSLRSPCPHEAMTRDRDTPHAPACRSVWHGLQRSMEVCNPSLLPGRQGLVIDMCVADKELFFELHGFAPLRRVELQQYPTSPRKSVHYRITAGAGRRTILYIA